MLSRDEVILKVGELQHELRTWKKVLQVLDRSQIEKRTGTAVRFYGMRPSSAIKMLLRDKGAQTQEWLLQELSDGGINVGKKRGEHNPRIAIEKTLRTGALKKVGNLIGLPEWGDEMFKGVSFDEDGDEDDEKRA